MKNIFGLITAFILLTSCGQRTIEQTVDSSDSTEFSSLQTSDNSTDLFLDTYFTFLNLDSLDEDMLRDSTIRKDYKYIKSVKRFTKEHCKFFRTGCSNTFFDENVFFVSKQKKIGDILPVIIHDSKDFNYYHSDLYTLDKNYNKIDSIRVSLTGSGIQSDEPSIYYETKVFSKFSDDKITTTEIEYWHYDERDSTVTKDSTIVYLKIDADGKIKTIKKEKII
ncbi:MAG: hypothetical protein ACK5QG_16060 [Bacteroidota bacterium]|jgi:hypothetical protein